MASSNFSGILQLTDLDDFIVPSQECIKPIKMDSSSSATGSKVKVESKIIADEPQVKLARVDISLDDCLACSGCITTAETVLISQQNHTELLRILEENNLIQKDEKESKFIVLTLSTQPVLSLAQRFNLPVDEAALKIAGYFKKKGVHAVFSTKVADEMAIQEASHEFIVHFKESEQNKSSSLPLFASACPGWICYAEKTHNFILPFISYTKSPQQIMGSIVKDYLSTYKNLSPKNIYHVTLMPCYDKKLEASRGDFYNEQTGTKDVDCVITPVEVELLLQSENVSLYDVMPESLDVLHELDDMSSSLSVFEGSTSGGYAHAILLCALKEFSLPSNSISFQSTRNSDIRECKIQMGDRTVSFAIVNGFRNIQNIVQKMKRKKCLYDYVEIMACPSGCINGSAQIRPRDDMTSKTLVSVLEQSYQELVSQREDSCNAVGDSQNFVDHLYKIWLGGRHTDKANAFLHTSYHAVPKNNFAIDIKW